MFTQSLFKNLTNDDPITPKQELLEKLYALKGFYGHAIEIDFVINTLIATVKGGNTLNGDTLRQASILDALNKNTDLVKRLVDLGATYTKDNIEDIATINKAAAQLLARKYQFRAKL